MVIVIKMKSFIYYLIDKPYSRLVLVLTASEVFLGFFEQILE